ncbi:polymerase/histidinol phosphatase-like putative isoform 1 [Tripterygium wilfordii]|uniref:Polymerase/histidinol phosphatase-like putative isoform 1 n=1 Tax=Tripterygium wilfordii TaxID=458696 RepID=A0A7J7BZZ2_TRIWF|nr:uncharacterized protein LOC119992296 [Tripterygium wilfordii]XP_038694932.1 uncharacterized protein LOC119992296 [Tripterygium wilfordii]KAF5727418.1 polymerase/histidinol phosphatase-like putative isoform 1 [Tripterygium wilfordii]
MGFFDLNVPYQESNPNSKTTRIRLVIKAMELGYTGIAHNRTMRGVMSKRDQCTIQLLNVASLVKVAPYLASSVQLHRDLLGVPRTSPFRQYTRITVYADSVAQAQVLNSGNPILKTYDLVAVRPLNQSAFDYACEKSEVDIIAIDFSDKLPYRMKQPMVKAAMERGVYFEITYSDLIMDVKKRRQMISSAKLLVDWTRGKNIILSSGAPSVNELRGPHDAANLSSLLGLSMERAKAAISNNCRTLVTKALRRKHFFKEAIRVEYISSGQQLESKKCWSEDWLRWDPISSGEGDLLLDNMEKSFSAADGLNKTVKAIDFASIVDSMPSQGFQVQDFMPGAKAVTQSAENEKNLLAASEVVKVPDVTKNVLEQPEGLVPPGVAASSSYNTPWYQSLGTDSSQQLCLLNDNAKAFTSSREIVRCTYQAEEESKTSNSSKTSYLELRECASNCEVNPVLQEDNLSCRTSAIDTELDVDAQDTLDVSMLIEKVNFPAATIEESRILQSPDVIFSTQDIVIHKDRMESVDRSGEDSAFGLNEEFKSLHGSNVVSGTKSDDVVIKKDVHKCEVTSCALNDEFRSLLSYNIGLGTGNNAVDEVMLENNFKEQDDMSVLNDVPLQENLLGRGQDATLALSDTIGLLESHDVGEPVTNSRVGNHDSLVHVPEARQEHRAEANTVKSHLTSSPSLSGMSMARQRRLPRQPSLFPFKPLLSPISFKKRGRKSKRRIKPM